MSKEQPKVTIVGAGNVGATAAHILLLKDICDVVLVDVAPGLPQGKALDLMHLRSLAKFQHTVCGSNDYAQTAGSDVVVITAGVARKPGMTREDLLGINSKIVRSVITSALEYSPDAIFILVTNPLDIMTNMAARISGLPKQRICGMGGVLDSARFAYSIARATGADINSIDALTVGAHGESMVCLPRFSTVAGVPITELLDEDEVAQVCRDTVTGGAQVVAFLKTGSAFYAPGASIARMVEAIIRDSGETMSVCAKLEGEYGIDDVFMCVPVRLGAAGVQEVVELPLDEQELAQLRDSAAKIAAQVATLDL